MLEFPREAYLDGTFAALRADFANFANFAEESLTTFLEIVALVTR